jgi:hypothetical protein
MAITDNLIPGLLLLQGVAKSTHKSELIWHPVVKNWPVYRELVYRLTYRGFEPLYELEKRCPIFTRT